MKKSIASRRRQRLSIGQNKRQTIALMTWLPFAMALEMQWIPDMPVVSVSLHTNSVLASNEVNLLRYFTSKKTCEVLFTRNEVRFLVNIYLFTS